MTLLKRYPLKVLQDDRGLLIQCDYPKIAANMKHFLISYSKPKTIRGNHYHKRKVEWFSILQGKVRLYLYDIKSKQKATYIISAKKPELVEMLPFVVHTVKNIGKEQMIFFEIINETFNSNDQDTYSYKLI